MKLLAMRSGIFIGPMLDEVDSIRMQTGVDGADFVDAMTDEGCRELGLPVTYPVDETGNEVGWDRCQPIGLRAWESSEAGIACRSAATRDRTGEELALFRRAGAPAPRIDRRFAFDEWFR